MSRRDSNGSRQERGGGTVEGGREPGVLRAGGRMGEQADQQIQGGVGAVAVEPISSQLLTSLTLYAHQPSATSDHSGSASQPSAESAIYRLSQSRPMLDTPLLGGAECGLTARKPNVGECLVHRSTKNYDAFVGVRRSVILGCRLCSAAPTRLIVDRGPKLGLVKALGAGGRRLSSAGAGDAHGGLP
jgi:hypothetical protein